MQAKLWQQLQNQVKAARLPHALLFIGFSNESELFVENFAQGLLCEHPIDGRACTQCKPCHLLSAQTHPDYHILKSTNKSETIGIDLIRQLTEYCEQTPQCADKKIVILFDADQMNLSASNALLKTLEEPAGNAYFFLTSRVPAALPATIRSRTQVVRFAEEDSLEVPEWQADFCADCASLLAGKIDPLVMAQKWQKQDLLELLAQFELYLAHRLRKQPDFIFGFTVLDKIHRLRKIALQHHSINPQLQLEALLIASMPTTSDN